MRTNRPLPAAFPVPDASVGHDYLTCREAAAYVRHAEGTLRNMSSAGTGPQSFKTGGHGKRLYVRAALDAWVQGVGGGVGVGVGGGGGVAA